MDNEHTVHGIEHDEGTTFEYPTYQYQIKDWEFKKKGLLKRIKEEKFVRTNLQTFETDRQTNKKSYLHYFQDLIKDELWEFVKEAEVTCSMTDCWAVRYQKGDQQTIHNHRAGIYWYSLC